jgi:hypothetical protein
MNILGFDLGRFGSNSTQQNQDNQYHQQQTQTTAGSITPIPAVRPGWQCA